MNAKTQASGIDRLKWLIVFLLLIAGFVANYYFSQVAVPIRIAGWIVLLIVMGLVAVRTAQGDKFWRFLKDGRAEVQRVVWPSRKETMQTTVLVFVMVVVVALILWSFDSVLMVAVRWLTGHGG